MATPRCFGFVGESGSGGEFTVDLVGVVGVVPECSINQCLGDSQEFCCPGPALIDGNVAVDDAAYHVGYLWSTYEDRPSAGRTLSEHHQRMGLHAETLIDEAFCQRGDPHPASMSAVLEPSMERLVRKTN